MEKPVSGRFIITNIFFGLRWTSSLIDQIFKIENFNFDYCYRAKSFLIFTEANFNRIKIVII